MDKVVAMDRVGDGILAENANWKFTGNVHETFDAHVSKSVPFYNETHDLGAKIADFFLADGSLVYDLGCSTGTFIELLAKCIRSKALRFVGIDSVAEMVSAARKRCAGASNITIEQADALDVTFEPCDFISAYYTIQFIRPA